jgi:hypothetical protein
MDYGYKFELLINEIIGRPDYVTYAKNWRNKDERTALLFTACIIKYDKNSLGENGEKLDYFKHEIFKDNDDDKKISIECLEFLKRMK